MSTALERVHCYTVVDIKESETVFACAEHLLGVPLSVDPETDLTLPYVVQANMVKVQQLVDAHDETIQQTDPGQMKLPNSWRRRISSKQPVIYLSKLVSIACNAACMRTHTFAKDTAGPWHVLACVGQWEGAKAGRPWQHMHHVADTLECAR